METLDWLPRHEKFFSTSNTYIILAILITGAKVMAVWSFDKNQIYYLFGTFKSDQTKDSRYFSHKIWIKRSYHKKIQPKITILATKKKIPINSQDVVFKSVTKGFALLLYFPVQQKWLLNPSQNTIHSKTQKLKQGKRWTKKLKQTPH